VGLALGAAVSFWLIRRWWRKRKVREAAKTDKAVKAAVSGTNKDVRQQLKIQHAERFKALVAGDDL